MNDSFNLNDAVETFLEEARDLLGDMESILLRLEDDENVDSDDVNAMFRAAHTVKGSAGLFGFNAVVAFGHEVETLLDQIRSGQLNLSPSCIGLLLQCTDHLGLLVDCAAEARELEPEMKETSEHLIQKLQAHGLSGINDEVESSSSGEKEAAISKYDGVASADEAIRLGENGSSSDFHAEGWHISLRFGVDTFRNGMDPLSFIRYLSSLGEILGVEVLPDQIPVLKEFDPEGCYLGFEIHFRGEVSKQELEDVFEFVREDCSIHILPTASKVEDFLSLINLLPEDTLRLGEILVKVGTLTQKELEQALSDQEKAEHIPLGEILVKKGTVQAPVVEAALAKQKQIKAVKARESSSVRVHADKLDSLIDLVGELVIATSAVCTLGAQHPDSNYHQAALEVSRLVEQMREDALRLRMVEIGETFSRFNRIVRDTAQELGKSVKLIIEGGETELDRTMVEKIADPLTHMVRNAIDHGIETPEARTNTDKLEKGTIKLAAYHDSGSVVIEVEDDGAGLNPDRIREKAISRGLIGEDDHLAEKDLYQLIFEPGFSTAEKVSNLSGRGVGMDVVKKTVEGLRGSIDIDSSLGHGTSVRLRLPLTLAIIDGFLLGVGEAHFVLPLDMVVECIDLEGLSVQTQNGSYVKVRESVIPYLRLREFFGFEVSESEEYRESLVIVQCSGQRFGLVVDELLGETQTVIKPLGDLFRHLRGISGFTILGSGKLALIIDVAELGNLAKARELNGMGANA